LHKTYLDRGRRCRRMGLEDIVLEQEQKDLLIMLVEGTRNVSHDRRQAFRVVQADGVDICFHPGLPGGSANLYMGDIDILANEGLVNLSYGPRGAARFDVTPRGFAYYEFLKMETGQPAHKIEQSIRSHLSANEFRKRYPSAYKKWHDAEGLLWGSDSEVQLTAIGHLCREAIQEFATAAVERFHPTDVDGDKANDVNRIRCVLQMRASRLGDTERSFLDALVEYWKAVSSLVQRQEHGGQKEGRILVWEDGRRVVFQTAVLMFEVDSALAH
jgi:hypothetical protein